MDIPIDRYIAKEQQVKKNQVLENESNVPDLAQVERRAIRIYFDFKLAQNLLGIRTAVDIFSNCFIYKLSKCM